MEKLVITAAPVGAEVTRADNPNLPLTPEEIAEASLAAGAAGASVIHLHVRDAFGQPTQDQEIFRRVIELIKSNSDLIIQVSTGGSLGMSREERAQPLLLRPEMASLTAGSVNFGDGVFMNPAKDIEWYAQTMSELGVKPELEVFELGMVSNGLRLLDKGILTMPLHFGLVLGVPGGIGATAANLFCLTAGLPSGCTWSAAAMSRHQLPIAIQSIILGGHVRVGFEDNVYYRKGELAQSNAQLVERIVRLARELGREAASPAEARNILGLICQA